MCLKSFLLDIKLAQVCRPFDFREKKPLNVMFYVVYETIPFVFSWHCDTIGLTPS